MERARVQGGLLGLLFVFFMMGCAGLWLGCAGAGELLIGPTDAGTGKDVVEAHAAADVSDGPTFSPLCYNRTKDVGESDFDCGGYCPPCALERACYTNVDCVKGSCSDYVCTAPAACSNGRKDSKETDVDCGGADCGGCAAGKVCKVNSDCDSGTCDSGSCS